MGFLAFLIGVVVIGFLLVMFAGGAVLCIALAPVLVPLFGIYLMCSGNVFMGAVVLFGSLGVTIAVKSKA